MENILSEVKMRAAILHCQGVQQKKICAELGIDQKTLWHWKNDPLFQEYERAYSKVAYDTAMNALTELGGVAAELLLSYLKTADKEDKSARKLCIDTMKLLLAMGKRTDTEESKGNNEVKEAMKAIKSFYKDEDKVNVIQDS